MTPCCGRSLPSPTCLCGAPVCVYLCRWHLSAVPTAQVDADRHPERTVLYRVLFHYFEQFLAEYESRFEREYGFLHPIIKEVATGHHERTKRAW